MSSKFNIRQSTDRTRLTSAVQRKNSLSISHMSFTTNATRRKPSGKPFKCSDIAKRKMDSRPKTALGDKSSLVLRKMKVNRVVMQCYKKEPLSLEVVQKERKFANPYFFLNKDKRRGFVSSVYSKQPSTKEMRYKFLNFHTNKGVKKGKVKPLKIKRVDSGVQCTPDRLKDRLIKRKVLLSARDRYEESEKDSVEMCSSVRVIFKGC